MRIDVHAHLDSGHRADVKTTRFGELFSRVCVRRTSVSWVQFFIAVASLIGLVVILTLGIETKQRVLEEPSS